MGFLKEEDTAMLMGMGAKAKQKASKDRKLTEFKKPTSDYYRLDLVIRDTVETSKTYTRKDGTQVERPIRVNCKAIKKDYKSYIEKRAKLEGVSISEYLHNLIDEDMKKNNVK